jgi:hypothetical protein
MQTKRAFIVSILVLVLLGTSGCGVSAISLLSGVVSTVEATFPVIAAAVGLDPATTQLISTYLAGVSTAVEQTATILASSATAAQKALEIAAAFAAVPIPNLPAGTVSTVVAVVQAVITAVENFLKATVPASGPTASRKPTVSLGKLSTSDQTALIAIQQRAVVTHQKALALVK